MRQPGAITTCGCEYHPSGSRSTSTWCARLQAVNTPIPIATMSASKMPGVPSGLKKLVGVLKDRGLDFTMVREIKAGSLPVQVVSPAEVPLQGRRDTSAEAGSSSRRQAPSRRKSIS